MKKSIKLISLCIIVVLATLSCGSDDGPGIDSNLYGTWTKVRTVLRNCGNPNDNSSTPNDCNGQSCETITITEDMRYEKVVTVRGQAETERGQVQIGETQLNFLPDNSTGNTLLRYTVTATSLTLTNETVICDEDFVYNK